MAHFYGSVRGHKGTGTRLGSKESGLKVVAASPHGAVTIKLTHDPKWPDETVVEVCLKMMRGHGQDRVLYRGPIDPFFVESTMDSPNLDIQLKGRPTNPAWQNG